MNCACEVYKKKFIPWIKQSPIICSSYFASNETSYDIYLKALQWIETDDNEVIGIKIKDYKHDYLFMEKGKVIVYYL